MHSHFPTHIQNLPKPCYSSLLSLFFFLLSSNPWLFSPIFSKQFHCLDLFIIHSHFPTHIQNLLKPCYSSLVSLLFFFLCSPNPLLFSPILYFPPLSIPLSWSVIMPTSLLKETSEDDEHVGVPGAGERKTNKWRLALFRVYGIKALSQAFERNNSNTKINRSLYHTIVNVNQESEFVFDQKSLTQLVKEKDPVRLQEHGGVVGVAKALNADPDHRIQNEEISGRREAFGSNLYENQQRESFLYFLWKAVQQLLLVILFLCGVISFVIGDWSVGVGVLVAVFVEAVVSATSDYRHNGLLHKLYKKSKDIKIEVERGGNSQKISIFDIVVGDVVCLKTGDQVPADGLLLGSHDSLRVDETSVKGIGESVEVNSAQNPFLFSGTKVVDGSAKMLVVSVGMNTGWGQMMSRLNCDFSEPTLLQDRLENGKSTMDKVLWYIFLLLFIWYAATNYEEMNLKDLISDFVGFLASVFEVSNSRVLSLILARDHAMKRMMVDDEILVRKLSACETMGFVTTICTDKTGILTVNKMEVKMCWVGKKDVAENEAFSPISPNVKRLIQEGGALTCRVNDPQSNPTEMAIHSWVVTKLNTNVEELKRGCTLVKVETFNSRKKQSGALVKREKDNTFQHVHRKGAAEVILAMCSSYYDASGGIIDMDDDQKLEFQNIIQSMAASGLKCIAFAHSQVPDAESQERLKEDGLILLAIMGISNPCRPEVRKAVEACQKAGVSVKMITGDNIFTAKFIAKQCGILRDDDNCQAVVEGAEFRSYSSEERSKMVDEICVLAGASPSDKREMVECLKQKDYVVAVAGKGINDAEALKQADIGISMGIQGTEDAEQNSDIVILNDNFASVVTIMSWGRCIYTNVQMAIQFQLTVKFVVFAVYVIGSIFSSVLLLFANLITDKVCAFTIAMEEPTEELLKKPPIHQTEPLITNIMLRNLLLQGLYQIALFYTIRWFDTIWLFRSNEHFDVFMITVHVMCQVFNQVNVRKLEKKNVFKDIHRNKWLFGLTTITILTPFMAGLILIRVLGWEQCQWIASIGIGASSWVIGWAVKFIPVPEKPAIASYLDIAGIVKRHIVAKVMDSCYFISGILFRYKRGNRNQQPSEVLRVQEERGLQLSTRGSNASVSF